MREPVTKRRPRRVLNHRSIPSTLADAQRMVDYCGRIIRGSDSWSRVERSRRMLANLLPHIDRLERQAAAAAECARAAGEFDETDAYVVVWSGEISRRTGVQPSDCAGRHA